MPDGHVYAAALLGLYAAAARPAGAQLQARALAARGVPEPVTYLAVMGLVAAWGVAVLGTSWLVPADAAGLGASLLLGAAAGGALVAGDRAVVRALAPRARPQPAAPAATWGPGALVSVGVLEEIVYRGVLTELLLGAGSALATVAGLAGAAAVFALSHLWFGWPQVAAKLMLAVVALGTVLATGAVLAAAVAHALFNAHAWRAAR